jgi:hypothetical protein
LPGGLEENHSIPPAELLISKLKFSSRTSWVKINSSDLWIGIFGHMAVLATTTMTAMTTVTRTTTTWPVSMLCALLLISVYCHYCIGVFLDSVLKMLFLIACPIHIRLWNDLSIEKLKFTIAKM